MPFYLTVFLALVVTVGAALYVVVNHSEKQQELTCEGSWRDDRQPEVAHVVLSEYRWWVHLWGDSDGYVKVSTINRLSLPKTPSD